MLRRFHAGYRAWGEAIKFEPIKECTEIMGGNRIASGIMFWLGVVFMTFVVFAMTPYTYQLDDIKVTLLHVLGPMCLVVYLLLVAFGRLEFPRKGVWAPLGLFFLAMVLSTLLTEPYARWQGWQGIWMHFALLGPFFAFFAASTTTRRLRRSMIFFTLLALGTTIFGILHYGYEVSDNRRYGVASYMVDRVDKEIDQLKDIREKRIMELRSLEEQVKQTTDPTEMAQLRARGQTIARRAQVISKQINDKAQEAYNDPVMKLARTFSSRAAQKDMMSVVLNRNFYASFLLLMLSITIGVFLTSGEWFMTLLKTKSSTERLKCFLSRSFWMQLVALLTILTSIYCIFATRSKISIYMGLAFSLSIIFVLYFFWLRREWKHRGRVVVFALVLIFLVIPAFLMLFKPEIGYKVFEPGFQDYLENKFYVSITSRSIIWNGALGIWKENPFFGAGPMTFGIMFPYHRIPSYFLYEISHRTIFAHNYFLGYLAETGLFGFLSLMAFLAFLVWKCLELIRKDPSPVKGILTIALVAGLAGFLLNNSTSPNSRWPIGAVNLWAVLGIMAGIINRPMRHDERAAKGERAEFQPAPFDQRKIAWVLCGVAFLGWIYTTQYGIRYFRASVENNAGLMITGDPGAGPDTTRNLHDLVNVVREATEYLDRPIPQRGPIIQKLQREVRLPQTQENYQLIASLLNEMKTTENFSAEKKQMIEKELRRVEAQYSQRRAEALDRYQKAIDILPTFTTSYYKMATLKFQGDRGVATEESYKEALEVYRKLQEYGPEYSQIRFNLGSTYLQLRDVEAAVRQYRKAADMSIDVTELNPTRTFILAMQRAMQDRKSPELSIYDFENIASLAHRLRKPDKGIEEYLAEHLSEAIQNRLKDMERTDATNFVDYEQSVQDEIRNTDSGKKKKELREELESLKADLQVLADDLNKIVNGPIIYEEKRFDDIKLSQSTRERLDSYQHLGKDMEKLDLQLLNRMLLFDGLKGDIALPPREEMVRYAHRLVVWWERIKKENKPIKTQVKGRLDEILKDCAQLYLQTARSGGSFEEKIRAVDVSYTYLAQDRSLFNYLLDLCKNYQDVEAMVEFCEKKLAKNPEDTSLRVWKGLALIEMKRFDAAEKQAEIARQLEKGGQEHEYLFFRVYAEQNMRDKATEYAEAYIKGARNPQWRAEARIYVQEKPKTGNGSDQDGSDEESSGEAGE